MTEIITVLLVLMVGAYGLYRLTAGSPLSAEDEEMFRLADSEHEMMNKEEPVGFDGLNLTKPANWEGLGLIEPLIEDPDDPVWADGEINLDAYEEVMSAYLGAKDSDGEE